MCIQTFSWIIGVFAIFNRDFMKTVAPPDEANGRALVHLKGNPL